MPKSVHSRLHGRLKPMLNHPFFYAVHGQLGSVRVNHPQSSDQAGACTAPHAHVPKFCCHLDGAENRFPLLGSTLLDRRLQLSHSIRLSSPRVVRVNCRRITHVPPTGRRGTRSTRHSDAWCISESTSAAMRVTPSIVIDS